MPILTANQLRAYNNVPATPYSPASIKLGNLLQLLLGGGSSSISRFYIETSIQNIFVETTGSDTTGDGLTVATAYATVNRALKDIPNGWTADVNVQLGAGTFAGSQNWVLNVTPGARRTFVAGVPTGRLFITGDVSTPVQALTGGVAGALVAGKAAQVTYAVGAYTATVTDGSHFVKVANFSTNLTTISAIPVRASATPNLIVVKSSTTALTNPLLMAWTTIFSGAVTINEAALQGNPPIWLTVQAIRFQVACTMTGATLRAVKFDVGNTISDGTMTGITFVSGTQTITGNFAASVGMSSIFVVTGGLSMIGQISSLTQTVIAGTPVLVAKLCGGATSSTTTNAQAPASINTFGASDFEGNGNGIRWVGGSITTGGSTNVTFALTQAGNGYPILLANFASIYCGAAATFTGTGTLGSFIQDGAALDTHGGYLATNSASAGQDVFVGELAVQAVATRPTTSPVQLARYS